MLPVGPGVSAAAPYRHFRDRDDLLADVASMASPGSRRAHVRGSAASPIRWRRLNGSGRAYLDFARAEPVTYIPRCSEAGIPLEKTPDLREGGRSCFCGVDAQRRTR